MMTRIENTNASLSIDLEADGKQFGHLRLAHSVHRSAYGWLPIPIVQLRNGVGPSVLVTGGNHGDEYSGQIVAARLARELPLSQVCGSIILMPMLNFPACQAGLRTSPIDEGNLNREFPGDSAGATTQRIAGFINDVLLPRVDVVVDLHCGGSSLNYFASVVMGLSGDKDLDARTRALAEAFAAPTTLVFDASGATHFGSTLIGSAMRRGTPAIATEIGGGGTTSREVTRLFEDGTRRCLHAIGSLLGEVPKGKRSRLLQSVGHRSFVYAQEDGVFEPFVDVGAEVSKGQVAGLIHDPQTPGREPAQCAFDAAGFVVARRLPAQTRRGDCLFRLGIDSDF